MTEAQRRLVLGLLTVCSVAAVALVAVVVVRATQSDGGDGTASAPSAVSSTPAPPPSTPAAPTTASPTAPETTEPPPTTEGPTTEASSTACPAGGPTPRGDVAPAAADLDGDGIDDTVYMLDQNDDGGRALGVLLTSGHSTETTYGGNLVASAYGPVDLNSDGREELFIVSSGNTASIPSVQVAVLDGCELVIAQDSQGEPYKFLVSDRGLEDGDIDLAGVGCTDVDNDGALDLVGLAGYDEGGGRFRWTRTVVRLEAAQLTNGATDEGVFQAGTDDAGIASLSELSCGDDPLDEAIVSDT